jgi:hypothetical protein
VTDPYRAKRREFIEQLGENWDRKKAEYFPRGPRTRDDRYVAAAIDRARADDINAHFGVSERETSYSVVPFESNLELPASATADFRVVVDGDRRIQPAQSTRLSGELMRAWLDFHPKWVAKQMPPVMADAIQRLRTIKSEILAARRRTRKNVRRNGRRTKANPPGPRPSRKPNLTSKTVSRKRVA